MVTTRRMSTNATSSVLESRTSGSVDVLERTYATETNNCEREETVEQARARMRGNLDLLLNYDRCSQTTVDAMDSPVVEEVAVSVSDSVDLQDENIRPTSTTMQFGDADVDEIYNEMHREKEETAEKYKLNGKGKLVVVLYALAVTVILALIVINTGVLARLSGAKEAKVAQLNSRIEQYQQLSEDIESISSNEYIIEQAEELGMVKR